MSVHTKHSLHTDSYEIRKKFYELFFNLNAMLALPEDSPILLEMKVTIEQSFAHGVALLSSYVEVYETIEGSENLGTCVLKNLLNRMIARLEQL